MASGQGKLGIPNLQNASGLWASQKMASLSTKKAQSLMISKEPPPIISFRVLLLRLFQTLEFLPNSLLWKTPQYFPADILAE